MEYAIKGTMDTTSGIVVDGVGYSYGSTVALDGVSLSIAECNRVDIVALATDNRRCRRGIEPTAQKNNSFLYIF